MSQRVNELNKRMGGPITTGGRFMTGASKTQKAPIFRIACENDVETFATVAFGFGSSLA